MKHLDLFSGIGGFAIAVREVWGAEYECVGFCDNDWFCQQVLKKNFPKTPVFTDIRALTNTNHTGLEGEKVLRQGRSGNRRGSGTVDLITGGFPCQPFSQAGKRRGTDDDRYLWPEMLRVIREFQPSWVIAENVGGLVTWSDGLVFEQVCSDLEDEGYEVQPLIIPAAAVNAPHRRDRVWFVAHNPFYHGQPAAQVSRSDSKGTDREPARPQEVRQPEGASSLWADDSDAELERPQERQQKDHPQLFGAVGDDSDVANTPSIGRREGPGAERPEEAPVGHEGLGQGGGLWLPDWERSWQEVAFATCVYRMDDGVSGRVVRLPDGTSISEARWRKEAIKAYGNAIVPQVAMQIMEAIKQVEES